MQNKRLILISGLFLALISLIYFNHPTLSKWLNKDTSFVPESFGQFMPREYSPQELKTKLENHEDFMLIDVRRPDEYAMGHIPGAINIPYNDIEALQALDKTKEVITYCTLSTWRAPYAAYSLFKSNHTNVALLTGGVSYWKSTIGTLTSESDPNNGAVMPKPSDLVKESPTDLSQAEPTLRAFTMDDLGYYDGKESRPAYVAIDGLVYDVSESPLWIDGVHRPAAFDGYVEVKAGRDLSKWLEFSPHGKKNIERFPVIGSLKK